MRQVEGQRKDFVRLGILGDWQNPYLTMNFGVEADIIRAVGKIAENGHLVKGYKPVYWSVVGGSALAEAVKVEYQDKTSFSIDVAYPVTAQKQIEHLNKAFADSLGKGPVSVLIWTTTPWTIPSSQAISVGAEVEYQLIQCGSSADQFQLICASDLMESVMERADISDYQVLASCPGSALENLVVQHPFYPREIPFFWVIM